MRLFLFGVVALRVAMLTGAGRIGLSELSTMRATYLLLMPIIGLAFGVTAYRRPRTGRHRGPGRPAAQRRGGSEDAMNRVEGAPVPGIAMSPLTDASDEQGSVGAPPPQLVSWNVTARCPLRCGHCYIDAGEKRGGSELSTEQGRSLIDQLAAFGRPLLILSGGEPLLRGDIYELASHATDLGLRVAMGTGGTLVTDDVAARLADAGIRTVAVSLDSAGPALHDRLRGVPGTWERAVAGTDALRRQGIRVQLNITLGSWNVEELDAILDFGVERGIRDYQCFFLVPTGRARSIEDLSSQVYETTIEHLLEMGQRPGLRIRPTCAPQFVRIADRMGLEKASLGRGCLAGLSYCRIDPTGVVTPCPYLPLALGNVLEQPFAEIWRGSTVLADLRNPDALGGRCGRCEFRVACGGCRARAFGAGRPGDGCGAQPIAPGSRRAYLDEDPGCVYDAGPAVVPGVS